MGKFKDFALTELGLTPQKFNKLMDFYFNSTATDVTQAREAIEAKQNKAYEEGMTALKTRLGDQLPDVINNSNALTEHYQMREFVTKHNLQNDPEFVGIMERISNDMSEARLKGIVKPVSGQSPADVDAKIAELRNHPAYTDRANPSHKAIREQVSELYKKKVG
jgi:hypothetical protein